ncbi:MAG: primosomal protein N' [Betaproteobacteria bacterium RIFCSPLOWO2_02_FULL_67_26]|nr:MAG: primosomal protein N' [Betaproteobacteria bacterium RIFCSPLOWO2_02_FULL_67_26]
MTIIRVALDVPVDTLFDYRAPDATATDIGRRVVVPFGRKIAVGVILETLSATQVPAERVRHALKIIRDLPPLAAEDLRLLRFAADYYHHPLGAVIMGALPTRLRRVAAPSRKRTRNVLAVTAAAAPPPVVPAPRLTAEQLGATEAVRARLGNFQAFLLLGVTGSGKTEVYLHAMAAALAAGQQALLLVPEIALTPQLEALVVHRFPEIPMVSLHSGLAASERLEHWRAARDGRARIVLGTRLAVFAPLPELGLIVVDEEQDASFKQAEGLRYSARDLAVVRARQRDIPVVLGSATPALETYHNAVSGRYAMLPLPSRIGAPPPRIACIDTRREKLAEGLSERLLAGVRGCLARQEQALVFVNRRGYAPVLFCRACGWIPGCRRCSARLVLHRQERRLRCHHCGHAVPTPVACPGCGNPDLAPIGHGTQRVEEALERCFPDARILRIDRDTTSRRRAWQSMRQRIKDREVDILVGTQIIAKGHDFPHLNLVAVLNADSQLYSTDFRAAERLFALLTQVAGRAGRGDKQGEVLIQTEFPQHPLYAALARQDYRAFADDALAERRQAGFPPFVHQALLRAEAPRLAAALEFLTDAARTGRSLDDRISIFDPVPAAMPRRAGRERAQLLVQSESRAQLQGFLRAWRAQLGSSRAYRARWAIDVDPLEF